ncbi:unnamed protein product [Ectocarpus sp. CCAP 1310/34]|nr:unnamed protein product [Ectocarpus sp. CCAP 1310/34]
MASAVALAACATMCATLLGSLKEGVLPWLEGDGWLPILLRVYLDSHSACALAASQAGLVAKEGGLIINGGAQNVVKG